MTTVSLEYLADYEQWFNSVPIDTYRGFKMRFDGSHADIFSLKGWILGYFYKSNFDQAVTEFHKRIDIYLASDGSINALSKNFQC